MDAGDNINTDIDIIYIYLDMQDSSLLVKALFVSLLDSWVQDTVAVYS